MQNVFQPELKKKQKTNKPKQQKQQKTTPKNTRDPLSTYIFLEA